MPTIRLAPVLTIPLLASGCLMLPVVEEPVYSSCRALASSGWTARVAYVADHHNRPVYRPTLIVSGRVTVPSDGYAVSLDLGPVQRLDAPVQQVLLRTEPPAPGTAPAPTDVAVSGAFPALKLYGAVTIRCGDGTLAIIKPVPRGVKPGA